MISQLLKYHQHIKEGKVSIPKAINLLEIIRRDRLCQRKDVKQMMQQAFKQQSDQFNIRQLFQTFKQKKYRNRVMQLQQELMELDQEYEIRTPTTIASEMSSECRSIRNLSFLTKHEEASANRNNNRIIMSN